jgi:hypothetical protein
MAWQQAVSTATRTGRRTLAVTASSRLTATSRLTVLDGVPIPCAIAEDGVTQAGVDARDAMWQHPDLLPDAADLDDPAGFIDRVDSSGIDEAIAEFERDADRAGMTQPTPSLDALDPALPVLLRPDGAVKVGWSPRTEPPVSSTTRPHPPR